MPSFDWSPVRDRLAWAESHAERVRQLSRDWTASAIRTDTSLDVARGVRVYRAEVVGEPPPEIALAVGDVVHHARAVLDNLVGIVRGGSTDRSMFRIDTDPAEFDRDSQQHLNGVPGWARAVFREIQPFSEGHWGYVGRVLAEVHRLAIIDRHRALLVSAALIDLNQTHAATSHPSSTKFALLEGGRVLTLEYPADAQVTPHSGVDVIVREPIVRWEGESAAYPFYPSAEDVSKNALWAVRQVVEMVAWAAVDADKPEMSPRP
jgi:hypothetical protein